MSPITGWVLYVVTGPVTSSILVTEASWSFLFCTNIHKYGNTWYTPKLNHRSRCQLYCQQPTMEKFRQIVGLSSTGRRRSQQYYERICFKLTEPVPRDKISSRRQRGTRASSTNKGDKIHYFFIAHGKWRRSCRVQQGIVQIAYIILNYTHLKTVLSIACLLWVKQGADEWLKKDNEKKRLAFKKFTKCQESQNIYVCFQKSWRL